MITYQVSRPKPPRHSRIWEKRFWREGQPLPEYWLLSELDGQERLRTFFVYRQDRLIQPLSDRAAAALTAMWSVEGCKLLGAQAEDGCWTFTFVHMNQSEQEFRLPYISVVTPEEMLRSAASRKGPVFQTGPAKPKGILDLRTVSFLTTPLPPVSDSTGVPPAPVARAAQDGPTMAETLGWSREQFFFEYWKLRGATP